MLLVSIKLWKYILQAKDLLKDCIQSKTQLMAISGGPGVKIPTFTTKGLGLISGLGHRSANHLVQPNLKKSAIHISSSVQKKSKINMEYEKTFSNIKLSFDCSHLILLRLLSFPSKHCP